MSNTCKGVIKNGRVCTSKPSDINGFCHKHTSQSKEYAKTHPWSVIGMQENGRETFIKVNGILEGAIQTSNDFGN